YSTDGTGSGSGSAAIARSAAIFGVDFSADQPASSRIFTNLTGFAAISEKSAASCVHATMTSSLLPSAAWNAPASLRQSWSCTLSGAPMPSAAASAFASSGTVRLQLQTLSVLLSRLIRLGFLFRRGSRRLGFFLFFFLFLVAEKQRLRLVQRRQHLLGHRLADGPVARKRLERIGGVEVRIAEELLQRHAPQRVFHFRVHEAGKVGLGRERLDRRQRRRGLPLLLDRQVLLLLLEPRPPAEKGFFLFLGHG